LREQYEKNERDLKYAADDREKLQERLSRTKNDLNLAEAALHKVEREKGSLKTDLNMVLKQQDVLKAQLEDETILRNELQACIDGELSTYNSLLESEENR
jgi:septal ring factor EnvC (AmiA/AmiB activator)